MSDENSNMAFMKNAHVIPEPHFPSAVSTGTQPTFGRQHERLFPGQPCYYCGDPPNSVDHLIPRSKAGADTVNNLVPCCFRCNQMKGNLTIREFVAKMETILKTLEDKPSIQIGARKVIQAGGKDILQCPLAA